MKTRVLIIIGIVIFSFVSILAFSSIEHLECKIIPTYGNCAHFTNDYPEIPQNDMYCWTQWYLEKTVINESELIPSMQKTIAEFGSHVDVPKREITVYYNEEETVISVAGVWTQDQIQHKELTSIVKNYLEDSKIIRDDIIMCS